MEREVEEMVSAGSSAIEPGTTDLRIDSNFNEMDYTFHSSGSDAHQRHFLHANFGDTFFFSHWTTTSHVHTGISCIVLLLLAVVHELLRSANKLRHEANSVSDESLEQQKVESTDEKNNIWIRRYVSLTALVNGLLSGSQTAVFYLLVMAVMTMNVWVYVSVVVGSVAGRFIPLSKLLPTSRRYVIEAERSDESGITKTA